MYLQDMTVFLITLFSLININWCLFEDQVSKWDFKQSYVGKPRFMIPYPHSNSRSVILATELNVISSIFVKNGSINWRHALHDNVDAISLSSLENLEDQLVTVDDGGKYLRSWNPINGLLNWETNLSNSSQNNILKVILFLDDNSNIRTAIFSLAEDGSIELFVNLLDIKTLSLERVLKVHVPSNFMYNDCNFINEKSIICVDMKETTVHYLILDENRNFVSSPLSKFDIHCDFAQFSPLDNYMSGKEPIFAISLGEKGHAIFKIEQETFTLVKVLSKTYIVATATIQTDMNTLNENYLFTVEKSGISKEDVDSMEFTIRAFHVISLHEEDNLKTRFAINIKQSTIIQRISVMPYSNNQYKILVSTSDGSIILFANNGKNMWTREEALAYIISTEVLDLPLSELDATIEQTLGLDSSNLFIQFMNRIISEMIQIQTCAFKLFNVIIETISQPTIPQTANQADLGYAIPAVATEKLDFVRDKFGLHKIIVILTKLGKIYGVDTLSGNILWSLFDEKLGGDLSESETLPILTQRTTAHYPYAPICTFVTKNGYILSIHPVLGDIFNKFDMHVKTKQVLLLSHVDQTHLKGILFLDIEDNVHVHPKKFMNTFLQHKDVYFMIIGNAKSGTIEGYGFGSVSPTYTKATRVWTLNIPMQEPPRTDSLKIVFKRPIEHVHSQGRVLGDRSVLYKYLNPNLVAVINEGLEQSPTINQDSGKRSSMITVYLLDGVTGSIMYSTIHKRAKGPVHFIHSENSIIYSYYNEKSRRTEISSIELYEGKSQVNATSFSSFSRHSIKPPIIEHQTYIFPTGIITMSDTLTEKGITNKHILIALPSGGILELPKAFLDPRRPIHPTIEHREEGLIPYVPELPIPSEGIINYNKSLLDLRQIITTPSNLESTSLVFAFGLDIFFTRVTPSKTFDILKDDFDHILISAVLVILVGVGYFSKWLAARKSLNTAWK